MEQITYTQGIVGITATKMEQMDLKKHEGQHKFSCEAEAEAVQGEQSGSSGALEPAGRPQEGLSSAS